MKAIELKKLRINVSEDCLVHTSRNKTQVVVTVKDRTGEIDLVFRRKDYNFFLSKMKKFREKETKKSANYEELKAGRVLNGL